LPREPELVPAQVPGPVRGQARVRVRGHRDARPQVRQGPVPVREQARVRVLAQGPERALVSAPELVRAQVLLQHDVHPLALG
jgi:hypothetical protein